MAAHCVRRLPAPSFVLAGLLLVHPAPSGAQPATFSINRIVACAGIEGGQPVGIATQFSADVGRIVIWFDATPAPRDIALRTEWYVNDAHVADASYDLAVAQGATSGYVTLGLPPGTLFPTGSYRVDLTSNGLSLGSYRFTVSAAAAPTAAPPPAFDRTKVLDGILAPRPAGRR